MTVTGPHILQKKAVGASIPSSIRRLTILQFAIPQKDDNIDIPKQGHHGGGGKDPIGMVPYPKDIPQNDIQDHGQIGNANSTGIQDTLATHGPRIATSATRNSRCRASRIGSGQRESRGRDRLFGRGSSSYRLRVVVVCAVVAAGLIFHIPNGSMQQHHNDDRL